MTINKTTMLTNNWFRKTLYTAAIAVASLPQLALAAGPEVSMAITPPEGPLTPGEYHIYRVHVANTSTVAATGDLVVEVNVPEFVAVSGPGGGATCYPNACTRGYYSAHYGDVIRWTVASIPAGGMRSLIFPGVVENSTKFPAPPADTVVAVEGIVKNGSQLIAKATTNIALEQAAPELDVALAGDTEGKPGDTIEYVAHFGNTSNAPIEGALKVVLPSGMSPSSISEGASISGNNVSWDLGSVSPGFSDTRSIRVTLDKQLPQGTFLSPRASARTKSAEASSVATMTTWITGKEPELKLSMSVSPNPAQPGGIMVYKIDVNNSSTTTPFSSFALWSAIPQSTTVGNLRQGQCSPGDCGNLYTTGHGSWVFWKADSLPPSGAMQFQFPASILKPKKGEPPPNGSLMVTEVTTDLFNAPRLRHVAAVGTKSTVGSGKPLRPVNSIIEPTPVAQPQPSTPVQPPASQADKDLIEPTVPFIDELDRPTTAGTNPRTPAQRQAAAQWSRYCVAKWRVKQWDDRCTTRWQKRADWKAHQGFWQKRLKPKK